MEKINVKDCKFIFYSCVNVKYSKDICIWCWNWVENSVIIYYWVLVYRNCDFLMNLKIILIKVVNFYYIFYLGLLIIKICMVDLDKDYVEISNKINLFRILIL